MRILHIADLHLGAKNSKLPKEKQDVLKDEMLENCHYLFEKIGQKFDVCLICGDLFHSKNVQVKIIQNFFQCIKDFNKPVLYINGNHDEKFILPSIPNNFIVLDKDNPKYEIADTCFYCGENIEKLDENKNNILLLHGNIENSQDNDYVDINKYLAYNFDYIALGHTHQIKKYKKGNNIFAYSGSLFSNGFDECGDKGYLDVEIEDKEIKKCEFVALTQRRYMLCEYDISSDENNAQIEQGIRRTLEQKRIGKQDIVRVILKGNYEEHLNKSLALLNDAFDDYFYIEIQDNSKLKLNIDSLKKETLSLKNEFISLVEASELTAEEKEKVINLGIEALKGDDLSL